MRAASLESWGLILNSFTELETQELELVKKFMKHDRVWAFGPLLPVQSSPIGKNERVGLTIGSFVPAHEVIKWLDSHHGDLSIVYVAFGSQITMNRRQMEAVASALEESGALFIWVVRALMKGTDVDEEDQSMIPYGFGDRVERRGLVIKGWAPQDEILRHRAVGSYLVDELLDYHAS
ncbi:UDP-glycosyltransferase 89C1-like [Prunus avium]|uniref:UDP-glycosyltransferase 89C1-like n=1 Tax=Prunus avium TaxID=42229 RepID=A0A6P5U4W1_PRUAV|nr:UDP-glycosyltransferase 89C1-like [Prunus avium]